MLSAYIAVGVVVAAILLARMFVTRVSRMRPWGNALAASLLAMLIASKRVSGWALDGVVPGLRLLVFYLALCFFFLVASLFFFDCSKRRRGQLFRHWQVAAFLSTAALLAACWGASESQLVQYPGVLDTFSMELAPVYLFHMVANLYLGYCCVFLIVNAALAARVVDESVRWIFCLASFGAFSMLVGGPILRIPSLVVHWAFGGRSSSLTALQDTGSILLQVGIVVFLGGLCALGFQVLRMLWREQRVIQKKIDRLYPVWEVLTSAIPDASFRRRGRFSPFVDRFRRDLRFRYDKLSIECEGALWRVSVYVDDSSLDSVGPVSFGQRAQLVYQALVRIHQGVAVATEPVLIAPTFDGDDRPLLVLAAELTRVIKMNGPPDQFTDITTGSAS